MDSKHINQESDGLLSRVWFRLTRPGRAFDHLSAEEALRVKLVNSFLLISFCTTIPSVAVWPILGNSAMVFLCASGLIIQCLELYVSYRGQHRLLKHLFSGLFPVYFVTTAALTGIFNVVALLSLPFITFTLFLFRNPTTRLIYVIGYSISLAIAYQFARLIDPLYPPGQMHIINSVALVFTFTLQVGFVHLFLIDLARYKKELAGKSKQWTTLFERNPYPLFLYRDGYGFVAVNNALCKILKADDPSQLIGRDVRDISPEAQAAGMSTEEMLPHIYAELDYKGHTRFEWIHHDLQGREFPVEVTLSRFSEADLLIGIWRDLTHTKEQERTISNLLASLEQKNAGLQATVEDRTREIEQANEELIRSNNDLEQFAYAVSHDLQEPLRMVGGFVQLLESRYGEVLDADGKSFIEFAVGGVERMSALIRDLLSYSRVGRGELSWKETDLNDLLGKKLQDLRSKIEEKNASVEVETLPARVMVEPALISMVFHNLINNALKFNRQKNPVIRVSAEVTPEHWICRVCDNGIGIPRDKREKIFEVFSRLHSQDEFKGTGIGLATVKKIIERHGGRIWVDDSADDQKRQMSGTTFAFTIPRDARRHLPMILEEEEQSSDSRLSA